MKRFIRISNSRFVHADAIRELSVRGYNIEIRYSPTDSSELLHFKTAEECQEEFNRLVAECNGEATYAHVEKSEPEWHSHPISELAVGVKGIGIGKRAWHACLKLDLKTLGDLTKILPTDVLKIHGVGGLTVIRIQDYLEERYGYEWR